jgi:DNA-binding transcriptional ArsR family regulator
MAGRGDSDIAAIGALVADPARCRILLALGDGRALPASRLASEAGVGAPTTSSHLRKLTDAGLLVVEAHGRHRYYRLAGAEVADLIEALGRLAPAVPVRSLRQGTRAQALREGRTCYDHLAGRLGVDIMSALIDRGHVAGGDGAYDAAATRHDPRAGYGRDLDYAVTDAGWAFLDDLGVEIPPRRRIVRYCVDWSEQRHHLSGALGRGLLDRLLEMDWIRRADAGRAVRITDAGVDGLRTMLGVDVRYRRA